MTVQELIDALSEYDPYLQVVIRDQYADTEAQIEIGAVYEDTRYNSCEEYVVCIEGGRLL